ncbi:MAG: 23S rRNA (adenine(2503)-C(2))-methyltransferase RlmN [Candidatus Korobacteraceae bacterium]|jgi:23S rRNA (adenine2503-C2)-methyltransferase
MSKTSKFELLGLSLQELTALAESQEQPLYRGAQLFEAIYRQRKTSIAEISTLPGGFRSSLLTQGFEIGTPTVERQFISVDGTVRYLIRFGDGQSDASPVTQAPGAAGPRGGRVADRVSVETVWMPEGDGGEQGDGSEAAEARTRATICISSQAGCAVNCRFCMTALLGLQRNLTAGEIVGQVLLVLASHGVEPERDRINLVFMGQGEPFLNYDNFMKAVRLLVEGAGIAESRMTVSTSGILPRIADFAREPVRPKLAISLNGSNDEDRSRVMPINRKWNIASLLEAARSFPLRPRERITFEYVLLGGENDSAGNAQELAGLLRGVRAKVNLIALNAGPGIAFSTPAEERVLAFQRVLVGAGIPAFIRRPRGRDIYAACGQLKRTTELAGIQS